MEKPVTEKNNKPAALLFITALLALAALAFLAYRTQELSQRLTNQAEEMAAFKTAASNPLEAGANERLMRFQENLALVEGRLSALESAKPANTAPDQSGDISKLSADIDTLKTKLAALEDLKASLHQNDAELATAQERLAALEEDLRDTAEDFSSQSAQQDAQSATERRQIHQLLLFDQLKNAMMDGRPYAPEYHELMEQIENTGTKDLLQPLGAFRDKGLPTWGDLTRQFGAALEKTTRGKTPAADAGMWEKFSSQVKGLVTVRKVGPQSGDSAEAILARAELAMSKQDMTAAIKEIESLPAPAQETFEEWLPQARFAAALPELLHQLRRSLLEITEKKDPA